jgi:hypothetical protein
MLMYENFEDTLEFTGGDGGNNYISIPQSEQSVLLPHINVNELPQLNPFATHNSTTVSSIMLDPKYNRPSIESFPVHNQPKSILFTPPARDLEWSKLPGFTPSMVKIWQEGFDVHKTDWKDSILEKHKHQSSTNHQASKFKDTSTFGMPDPGDLEPDEDGENQRKFNCEKSESKIWKELDNYRNGYKTNSQKGSNKEYYKWDHTHNDIEVFDHQYYHKGSLNPRTGKLYKDPVKGRRAWDIAK